MDETCRSYIEAKGYGDYFVHSTGHGIGLEVHEQPNVSHRSKSEIKTGMALTVEPGIYIKDKFGIRIEDSVIVRNRAVVMHKFTKDLIVI